MVRHWKYSPERNRFPGLLFLAAAFLLASCTSYNTVYSSNPIYSLKPVQDINQVLYPVKPDSRVRITLPDGSTKKAIVIAKAHDFLRVKLKRPKDVVTDIYYKDVERIEKSQLSLGKTAALLSLTCGLLGYGTLLR